MLIQKYEVTKIKIKYNVNIIEKYYLFSLSNNNRLLKKVIKGITCYRNLTQRQRRK